MDGMRVEICLDGCDDSTRFYLDVEPYEMLLLQRLVVGAKSASEYDCQPTMTVAKKEGTRG